MAKRDFDFDRDYFFNAPRRGTVVGVAAAAGMYAAEGSIAGALAVGMFFFLIVWGWMTAAARFIR